MNHFVKTLLAGAIVSTLSLNTYADQEKDQLLAEIALLKSQMEARLNALESRLAELNSTQSAPSPLNNSSNPSISVVLGGSLSHQATDPEEFHIPGAFPNSGEIGPVAQNFSLGEAELTLSGNIDPHFYGEATFAISTEGTIEVEQAFVQTLQLGGGTSVSAGRFFSNIGYLNTKHAHAWDFLDLPLMYKAFHGGQHGTEGLRATWLVPTDQYLEVGLEIGNGDSFPGTSAGNAFASKNIFMHTGGDIGYNASWLASASYKQQEAVERSYLETLESGDIDTFFSGDNTLWTLSGVYKWNSPGPDHRKLIVQGEYHQQKDVGVLSQEINEGAYKHDQSGWYAQAMYGFAPKWQAGLRLDQLNNATVNISELLFAPTLSPINLKQTSVVVDFKPSEFSRLSLQYSTTQDDATGIGDQWVLQYYMSLGAHNAHSF